MKFTEDWFSNNIPTWGSTVESFYYNTLLSIIKPSI